MPEYIPYIYRSLVNIDIRFNGAYGLLRKRISLKTNCIVDLFDVMGFNKKNLIFIYKFV